MTTTKNYELTPEHRAQLESWRDRWIANALSTAPLTSADHEVIRTAVRGLYQAANLTPPPDERIVIVPSPTVARFAGGFAAAIWYLRRHNGKAATRAATAAATEAATGAATGAATAAATRAATAAATGAATEAATAAATEAATAAATGAATWAATGAATEAAKGAATAAATAAATWAATAAATWAATAAATAAATGAATGAATDGLWYRIPVKVLMCLARAIFAERVLFGLQCAVSAFALWNGGNEWLG